MKVADKTVGRELLEFVLRLRVTVEFLNFKVEECGFSMATCGVVLLYVCPLSFMSLFWGWEVNYSLNSKYFLIDFFV